MPRAFRSLLGAVGVLSRSTSVDLALVVAFADLVGWGYRAGRRSYGTLARRDRAARSVAVALGLFVVSLKSLLH